MSIDPDLVRCVSLPEAASRLTVSVRTLYDMEKAGELHISRIGRRSGVALYEIMRILDARKRPADGLVDGPPETKPEKIELFPRVVA